MNELLTELQNFGIPNVIILGILFIFVVLQIIGELMEVFGKTAPLFLKIRKLLDRSKEERQARERRDTEIAALLAEVRSTQAEVKSLFTEVNMHYSVDNIRQRNQWMRKVDENMEWVAERSEHYDASIQSIVDALNLANTGLIACTKMSEDMFVENSRDRIIDFAEKVADPNYLVSHEQFRRIFRVYEDYENFLVEHNRTNGEIDRNYAIIQDAYDYRVRHHSFIENLNIYNRGNNHNDAADS